jgi:hypothetical protein
MANTTKRRFWRSNYCQLPGHCTERSIFASSKTELHHAQQIIAIDFIPKAKWRPSSPVLNPLDFSICGYTLAQQKNYKYQILPDLQKVILRIWAAIPDDVMRTACNAFEKQLNNYHGKSIRE